MDFASFVHMSNGNRPFESKCPHLFVELMLHVIFQNKYNIIVFICAMSCSTCPLWWTQFLHGCILLFCQKHLRLPICIALLTCEPFIIGCWVGNDVWNEFFSTINYTNGQMNDGNLECKINVLNSNGSLINTHTKVLICWLCSLIGFIM